LAYNETNNLIVTIPSKGRLEEQTLQFMRKSGLKIYRPNPRQYEAGIEGNKNVKVLFQRAADIPEKVNEGSADLGITGLDLYEEYKIESANTLIIHKELGFGKCQLVLAVSDDWWDVSSMDDVADLSNKWHNEGKGDIKVATKFPRVTRNFLHKYGVYYFTIIETHGALELAPKMGYGHIISDLVETGTTLRENRLKIIRDGIILNSQACLIGNKKALKRYPKKLELTKKVIEYFESQIRAEGYYSIVANIKGNSPEEIFNSILDNGRCEGLRGPTISKVYTKDNTNWYAINIVVYQDELFPVIEHLRKNSSEGILVFPAEYIFENKSVTYSNLLSKLKYK